MSRDIDLKDIRCTHSDGIQRSLILVNGSIECIPDKEIHMITSNLDYAVEKLYDADCRALAAEVLAAEGIDETLFKVL